MNWRAYGVVFLSLLLLGFAMEPVQRPAWRALRAKEPALDLASVEGALGQGVTVGLLGGFRALVANFMWLNVNAHWEDYDLPGTETMINLVTTIDPRPTYFWLNGSRIIGYDMPVWRVREIDSDEQVPQVVRERIEDEQGALAIEYLERGLKFHPNNPFMYIEIGNLYQRKRRDLEKAAEYFRIASAFDDAPAYAARIYAILLERTGRDREAYEWLRDLYPTLDTLDPIDRSNIVLERIRELEEKLDIPSFARFRPEVLPGQPRPGGANTHPSSNPSVPRGHEGHGHEGHPH